MKGELKFTLASSPLFATSVVVMDSVSAIIILSLHHPGRGEYEFSKISQAPKIQKGITGEKVEGRRKGTRLFLV